MLSWAVTLEANGTTLTGTAESGLVEDAADTIEEAGDAAADALESQDKEAE
jgi:hypothetical protein